MGAGVLPVSLHNGTLYFLFGQEADEQKWCDFGGGSKSNETIMQTAIREGCEELSGFFGNPSDFNKLVKQNLITEFTTQNTIKRDNTKKSYTTILFEIVYDGILPIYFNNQYKFIKTHRPHLVCQNGLFEKRQIKWMTISDIKTNKKYFRPYYRSILDSLIEHEAMIKQSIK